MDKLDQVLSNMVMGQKSLADSKLQFTQLQNQMEQGITKNSEWLFKKEQQMSNINSEFGKIRKEIKY